MPISAWCCFIKKACNSSFINFKYLHMFLNGYDLLQLAWCFKSLTSFYWIFSQTFLIFKNNNWTKYWNLNSSAHSDLCQTEYGYVVLILEFFEVHWAINYWMTNLQYTCLEKKKMQMMIFGLKPYLTVKKTFLMYFNLQLKISFEDFPN